MGKWIFRALGYIKNCILDTVYDEEDGVCLNCGMDTSSDFLCTRCMDAVEIPNEGYDICRDGMSFDAYSGAYYCEVIKNMVIGLKYKDRFRCGEFLAYTMIQCCKRFNISEGIDYITYVPMTERSYDKRGFNQSLYLANLIGNSLNIKVVDLLKKDEGNTSTQKRLDMEERWENAKNIYKLKVKAEVIVDKNIILIDDVLTTGATAFSCCLSLKKSGAGKVKVLTSAKSRI